MSKNPRRKPGDVLADLLGDDEDKESNPTLTRRSVPKSSYGADSASDISEADVDEIARQLEEMDDMEANLFGSKKPNKALEKKKGVHDIKDSPEKSSSVPSAVVKPKKIKFDDFDEDSPLAGLLSDEDDSIDNKKSSNQKKKSETVEVPVVSSVKESSQSPSKEIISILKKPAPKENVDFDGDEDLLDGLGLTDSPPARRKSSIKDETSINKESDSKKNKSFLDTLLGKTENIQSPEKKTSAKSDAMKFGSYMPTFGTSQTSSRRQSSTDELKEWLKEADSLPNSSQKDTSKSNTYTETKSSLIGNHSETEKGKSRTGKANDEWLEKEDTQYSFGNSAEKASTERRRGSSRPRPKVDWLDADKSAFPDGSSTNESVPLSNSTNNRSSDYQENRTSRSAQKPSSSDWLGIEDNLGSSNENVGKTAHNRRSSSIVETSLKGSPSLDELLQPKSTSTPINRSAENEGVRIQSQGQSESISFQRDNDRSHFTSQLSNAAAESTVESRLVAGYNSADVRKAVSAGEVVPPFDSSKVIQRPRINHFLNMEESSTKQFLHPKPVESRSLGEISNYDVSAQSSSSYIPPTHNVCSNCIYLATSGKLNALNNLELKVGQLEMEKTELREVQKVIQNHQKQEMELLKEAYKYHVKQLEEALDSKELRLKTEINNLEEEIQNKSRKWEKEKRSILDTHEQQIESLRKEWAKEMDEMKSLYKQSISELKQNQSLLSDKMKFFSGLGELNNTSFTLGPMQNSAFQPLLDHITRQNEELQRMKERLNDYKQSDKGEQEIRYHFLNEQIRQQQSSIDLERSQMKQLILRLEEQLYQRTNSTEERQKLMEEQAQMKQYLVQGLTELERAKMKFNEDRERLLQQLQEVTQVEVTKKIHDLLNTENSEEVQKLKMENELQTIVSELLNKEHYLNQLQEELKSESEQINRERLSLEEFRNKLELDREEIKLLARQVQMQLERAEEIEMSAKRIEKEGLASLELSRKIEEEQQSRMQALQQQLNTIRSKEQHLIQEEKKITQERIAMKNLKSSFICPSCSVPMIFAGNNLAFPPPSTSTSLPLLHPSTDSMPNNVNVIGNQSISEPVLNKVLSDLPSSNDVMVLLDKANRAKLFTLNSSPTAVNSAQYTTLAEELLSGGLSHHHHSNNPLFFGTSAPEWPPRTEGSSFEANLLSYKLSAEKDRQDLAEEEYFLQSITNS